MITDTEVKEFNALPGGNLACVTDGDRSIIHNQWLVIELPVSKVDVTREWTGEVMPDVRQWRYTQLPNGDGEVAMLFRGDGVIRLKSETAEALVRDDVHELLQTVFDYETPVYRLFPGNRTDGSPNAIGIQHGDHIIGAVAPYVENELTGWLTVE
jgi:hypothetical protein